MARSLADDLATVRDLVERGERLSLPRAEALLWIDTLAAAERRRQARAVLDTVNAETRMIDYPSAAVDVAANAFLSAIAAEDATLVALTDHVRATSESEGVGD